MIRFEIPPKIYSQRQKIWRWVGFCSGTAFLVLAFFFISGNKFRQFSYFILGANLILFYSPITPKKQIRFVELDDTQIKWNNNEEYNNKLLTNGPEVLSWQEITRIKRLQNNELMFFVENSFYRRLPLNNYAPEEQTIILDTIKAYAERLSLTWVEEQPVAAVA